MFSSPELEPQRILEGILPRDRYSQLEESNETSNSNETEIVQWVVNDNVGNNIASVSSDTDRGGGGDVDNRIKETTSSTSLDLNDTLDDNEMNNTPIPEENKATRGALYEGPAKQHVISADDFLPLFTYILIQSDLPQLLLVKEVMTNLVDDEETYGECGYYMITLEAATQHILSLHDEYTNSNSKDKESYTQDIMKSLE